MSRASVGSADDRFGRKVEQRSSNRSSSLDNFRFSKSCWTISDSAKDGGQFQIQLKMVDNFRFSKSFWQQKLLKNFRFSNKKIFSIVGRFQIQQQVQLRRRSSNCGCKEKAKYSKVQQVFKGTSNYANVQICRRYANVQQDAPGSTNILMQNTMNQ